jgi:hypothetical protein
LEGAFWIGDSAELEAGGDFGAEVGGDQVVLGDFAGVDVKAGADFEEILRTTATWNDMPRATGS